MIVSLEAGPIGISGICGSAGATGGASSVCGGIDGHPQGSGSGVGGGVITTTSGGISVTLFSGGVTTAVSLSMTVTDPFSICVILPPGSMIVTFAGGCGTPVVTLPSSGAGGIGITVTLSLGELALGGTMIIGSSGNAWPPAASIVMTILPSLISVVTEANEPPAAVDEVVLICALATLGTTTLPPIENNTAANKSVLAILFNISLFVSHATLYLVKSLFRLNYRTRFKRTC